MTGVVVAAFSEATEAHLARARLEAAGVEAWIGNEHFSSVYPLAGVLAGGVKLMVREEDATLAEEVLYPDDAEAGAAPQRCPQCDSAHVGVNTVGFTRLMLLTLLTCGLYLPVFYRRNRCDDCGCRW